MNITISDKKKKDLFVSIFQLLKGSSTHINVSFSSENMYIQGMDKSHICLFDLNLKKEWFANYVVNEPIELAFDLNIFCSIISTRKDDQHLVIKKVDDDSLIIELINGDKKSYFSNFFTMSLIDYEYDKMNIPETDYDVELSLPSKKVTELFSQLKCFSDDLNIKCSEQFVDFKSKGIEAEMRVNVPIDDLLSYSIVEGEEFNFNYSLIYINQMCITNKLSSDIDFYLSIQSPMKIKYDLGDDSSLLFYIAPKLTDDN